MIVTVDIGFPVVVIIVVVLVLTRSSSAAVVCVLVGGKGRAFIVCFLVNRDQ